MVSAVRSSTNAVVWLLTLSLLVLGAWIHHPSDAPLLDTNILSLLPENQQNPLAQQAFNDVSGEMENEVLFLVGLPSQEAAMAAALVFADKLAALPLLFEDVSKGVSPQKQAAFGAFFAQAKAQFLTPKQKDRLLASPSSQINKIIETLYNPFSGVTGAELSHDPFLLFREFLEAMTKQNSRFSIHNGFLITEYENQHYVLLRATLAGSAYSLKIQDKLASLERLERDIEERFSAKILHTGVVFYAAFGTQSAQNEISSIGMGSLIGILLLVIWVYRSLLPVGLALLSISCGIVTAFSVCLLFFGQIHLFSLIIGASLIGVSIDYSFHYLTERLALGDKWEAKKGLSNIFIPITFGLISTLIAYLSMFIAPFPGLQQLALFSAAGLIGAYLSVVCWYPVLAKRPSKNIPLPLQSMRDNYLLLWQGKPMRWAAIIVALFLGIQGLMLADHNDDIKQLQSLPKALMQSEAQIQNITALSTNQPMLLVTGESEQALLENMFNVTAPLQALKSAGALLGYQNIADFVPPLVEQKNNYQQVRALYQTQGDNLAAKLNLAAPPRFTAPFNPLLPQDFLSSLAGEDFASLWLTTESGLTKETSGLTSKTSEKTHAAIILLQQVTDIDAINAFAKQTPHVTLLNKSQEISQLFGEYRNKISLLMISSCLVIFLVLIFRFGFKRAVFILTPPLLACGVALWAGAISPVPMNLFNLLALFLVLGIGIDYSLFFAEQTDSSRALLANSLAAITTLLSFGLLCLSNTQAIHSFGLTVLVGILAAWFLSPFAILKKGSQ